MPLHYTNSHSSIFTGLTARYWFDCDGGSGYNDGNEDDGDNDNGNNDDGDYNNSDDGDDDNIIIIQCC